MRMGALASPRPSSLGLGRGSLASPLAAPALTGRASRRKPPPYEDRQAPGLALSRRATREGRQEETAKEARRLALGPRVAPRGDSRSQAPLATDAECEWDGIALTRGSVARCGTEPRSRAEASRGAGRNRAHARNRRAARDRTALARELARDA